MKYVATINGKKYEVEVEKLEAYKSLDRNGVAAPAAPVLPASAPVQRRQHRLQLHQHQHRLRLQHRQQHRLRRQQLRRAQLP